MAKKVKRSAKSAPSRKKGRRVHSPARIRHPESRTLQIIGKLIHQPANTYITSRISLTQTIKTHQPSNTIPPFEYSKVKHIGRNRKGGARKFECKLGRPVARDGPESWSNGGICIFRTRELGEDILYCLRIADYATHPCVNDTESANVVPSGK
jgi:hypothetical protein